MRFQANNYIRFQSTTMLFVYIFLLFGFTNANWWEWTKPNANCVCYFDKSRTDCACCEKNGCQCGQNYIDRCIKCGSDYTNCAAEYKANWWDWTSSPIGCECYFDSGNYDCACCKNGGCQCGISYPDRCIQCGSKFENCQAVQPTPTAKEPKTCENKILVPLYVWPANVVKENNVLVCKQIEYVKAAEGGDKVISIININSGVGTEDDTVRSFFHTCAKLLKTGGNTVIGYVSTNYGKRASSLVERDINKWHEDFGSDILDGIFLDETISIYEPEQYISKYTNYATYIRNKWTNANAMVIGNAGQGPHYNLLKISGLTSVVAFEKPYARLQKPCTHYQEGTIWCQSGHDSRLDELIRMSKYGEIAPSRLATMIYGTNRDSLNAALDASVNSYAGLIYVTDADTNENLWGRLPNYWDDLLAHEYFKTC